MEKKHRRKFSADFKAKVVLEALKEWNTVEELAKKHEVHPDLVPDVGRFRSEHPVIEDRVPCVLLPKPLTGNTPASIDQQLLGIRAHELPPHSQPLKRL